MALRNDRDAQLARADALERENRLLRERLEEHEAAARSDEELERENQRLRARLARARRPWLGRALGRWARRRTELPPASPEGGYLGAALLSWRLYLAALPMVLAQAVAFRDPVAVGALVAYVAGTPLLAAVAALVPWLLGARRRPVASGAAGLAIGLALAGALCLGIIYSWGPGSSWAPLLMVGTFAVSILLAVVLRAVRLTASERSALPWFLLVLVPGVPVVIWLGWSALAALLVGLFMEGGAVLTPLLFAVLGARLAGSQPDGQNQVSR